jgi:ATP/maltotriose-dependent transcriptional regulator MalT
MGACAAGGLGNHSEAVQLAQAALALVDNDAVHWAVRIMAFTALSEAQLGQGDVPAARHAALNALADASGVDASVYIDVLESFARLLCQIGERETAVEVAAFIAQHPAAWRIYRTKASRLLAQLETELAPDEFAKAEARGRALTLDEAVAHVKAALSSSP